MPQGFLAVSSHPSPQLPIKEFNEWYDEEHIPLRLNNLKEFLSGARYKVVSRHGCRNQHESEDENTESIQTSWLALYTVSSPAIFSSSAYQALRINRSDREKDVMSRIEVLIRITGEIVGTHLNEKMGFSPGRPSGWVVTHGIQTQSDGISSWASKIEHEVTKYGEIGEGWARTLLVLVLESGVSRFETSVEANDEVKMPYFAVHGKLSETSHWHKH